MELNRACETHDRTGRVSGCSPNGKALSILRSGDERDEGAQQLAGKFMTMTQVDSNSREATVGRLWHAYVCPQR